MTQKRWFFGVLCAALLLPLAAAEPLVKPLPVPDTSKLPAVQAKKLTDSRAAFDKARDGLVGPPLAHAYADMGVIYARAGFRDVAAVALYDASQIDPHDGRWFYLRGVVARQMKRDADARANFEAALALDKVYLPIRYRLSDTLVDLGDVDAARKLLQGTIRDYPKASVPYAMLGQLDLRQKHYTQAIENLLSALKLEPQANQLYKALSEAYAGVGNTQAASDASAKAGDVAPKLADPLVIGLLGASPAQPAGATAEQAEKFARAGHVSAARRVLLEMLKADPHDIRALNLEARLEASVGDFPIAAAAADQALKQEPNNAEALMSRAMVYEYSGDDEHAYGLYRRAVAADAKLGMARMLLGNAEMRRGRYAAAAEQYRAASTLLTGDNKAQARLVAAEVAAGRCKHALDDISAAQGRNPSDGDLMQIFVRLASTCPGAGAEERDMALDYAQALYRQRPNAGDSTALALALAAHGKFKDAQQYQAEAIFEAVRSGNKTEADNLRSTQAIFAAGKVPDRPWPATHPFFKPPLLTPARPIEAKAGK